MKSWVCAVTEDVGLIPVRQEIVNVTHLMMCRDKPALRYLSALFYSEKENLSKLSNRWANKRTKKHEAKEKEKKKRRKRKREKKLTPVGGILIEFQINETGGFAHKTKRSLNQTEQKKAKSRG